MLCNLYVYLHKVRGQVRSSVPEKSLFLTPKSPYFSRVPKINAQSQANETVHFMHLT